MEDRKVGMRSRLGSKQHPRHQRQPLTGQDVAAVVRGPGAVAAEFHVHRARLDLLDTHVHTFEDQGSDNEDRRSFHNRK